MPLHAPHPLRALSFCALLALAGLPAFAEGELELTTERVVVFKDGYCLVVKEATGTSDARGEVWTEDVPEAAILGSFWATPAEGRLLGMTAGVVETEAETLNERACAEYLELLSVNEGKIADVVLDDGSSLDGEIRRVLTREVTQPTAPPTPPWVFPMGDSRALLSSSREVTSLTGALFVLGTQNGDVVLPVSRVKKLTMKEMRLTIEDRVKEKRSAKRLTFRFEGGAAPRKLSLIYFRPGVRWIPTYRVELGGEAAADGSPRAGVRLQAELLNEAEDFVDVPFDVVVGVPNFRFKEVVSPLVLEQTLRNALAQAAPQLMAQQLSNSNFQMRSGEHRGGGRGASDGNGAIEIPDEITSGRSQDLFVYHLPRMTLRRGERAGVPVFAASVPYREVYTWDVALTRKDVEGAPNAAGASPLDLSTNRIWHQIELVNGTDVPWTTGAALVMEGLQPVAQELLTYTSPGGTVRLPLTVAVDLRGTYAEEETGRDLQALEWLGYRYARIEKKGAIELTSFIDRPADVEITCRLGGHADAATPDGRITLGAFDSSDWVNYNGHPAVNHHSVVSFTLTLAPRETVRPEIRYHYFTRH